MQKERRQWDEDIKDIDPNRLVFLDETSVNCGMRRLYGRALSNERIYDYVPDVRFKRTSIISTMRLNGDSVPFMFKGTLDGDLFIGYIENFLAPTLKEGDILVLDSASSHKKHELELMDILDERDAEVRFLPRYSPDKNPKENAWSKAKSTLRKLKARTEEALEAAVGIALDFTLDDLTGWFRHSGYEDNN